MRTLPLLAIAALVAVPLQGQSLAVRGGMNWGTWGGDDAPTDVGYRMGFAFGAAAVVPLADNVALDIGAGYTQKGMQVDEILGTLRTKIDYIDLPIFLRVEMPAEEGPVFYLVGGPTVSFKVSCGLEFEPATGAVVTEDCVDADVKSWDVGATGGLGLDMEVGEGTMVGLMGTYTYGFVSVDDSAGALSLTNTGFGIRLSVGFPIK